LQRSALIERNTGIRPPRRSRQQNYVTTLTRILPCSAVPFRSRPVDHNRFSRVREGTLARQPDSRRLEIQIVNRYKRAVPRLERKPRPSLIRSRRIETHLHHRRQFPIRSIEIHVIERRPLPSIHPHNRCSNSQRPHAY
jgi:hypothetical protein